MLRRFAIAGIALRHHRRLAQRRLDIGLLLHRLRAWAGGGLRGRHRASGEEDGKRHSAQQSRRKSRHFPLTSAVLGLR